MKTHKSINKIVDCNLWYGENKQGASIENEDRSSLGRVVMKASWKNIKLKS